MARHTQRLAHPTCTAGVHQRPRGRPPTTEDRTARGPRDTPCTCGPDEQFPRPPERALPRAWHPPETRGRLAVGVRRGSLAGVEVGPQDDVPQTCLPQRPLGAPPPPRSLAADSALIPLGFICLRQCFRRCGCPPRGRTRLSDPPAERFPLGLLETPTQASPGHSPCWD